MPLTDQDGKVVAGNLFGIRISQLDRGSRGQNKGFRLLQQGSPTLYHTERQTKILFDMASRQ